MKRVLITGEARFIGSHLAEELLQKGYAVRILDNLEPQAHSQTYDPSGFGNKIEFIHGDIRDLDRLSAAVQDVHAIFHMAAMTGVGQSMYEIHKYTDVNVLGTANLLQILADCRHNVEKLVVASSMAVYGEGGYTCRMCGPTSPGLRTPDDVSDGVWEMKCPKCRSAMSPVPSDEEKSLYPISIYGISKLTQEQMAMAFGRAYDIPTTILRYFNIYGPRQSLSNPYTGVIAVFVSRICNGYPPTIFEDGLSSRDFVHVKDIVRANLLALERAEADFEIFNVGTGCRTTILEIAQAVCERLGFVEAPVITNTFIEGYIRHCYADVSRIKSHLSFEAKIPFKAGIDDVIDWAKTQVVDDRFDKAFNELQSRNLAHRTGRL